MQLRRVATSVALAALGGLGSLTTAAPASAAPATGTVTFSGDAADYLTTGATFAYAGATDQLDLSGDAHHVGIAVNGENGDWWTIDVAAPQGQTLTAGTTYAATRYPFNTGAGFDLRGNGRGCSTSASSVTVRAITVDDLGAVTGLDATFEQHCEGASAVVRGRVDIGLAPAPADLQVAVTTTGTRLDASGGVLVTGTLTCSADTTVSVGVVVTQAPPPRPRSGLGGADVDCRAGSTATWEAFAQDATGPFRAGEVTVVSTVSGADPWTGQEARATDTDAVRLTGLRVA